MCIRDSQSTFPCSIYTFNTFIYDQINSDLISSLLVGLYFGLTLKHYEIKSYSLFEYYLGILKNYPAVTFLNKSPISVPVNGGFKAVNSQITHPKDHISLLASYLKKMFQFFNIQYSNQLRFIVPNFWGCIIRCSCLCLEHSIFSYF
eukprot:TRINITY_DN2427_c1_g1_i1.p1 TRINITY_DN2427_c1_g1~~TRINITY_DN2427_c1_g1_i1.p1  ORF type:complete len:156 (+),score=23.91 TRINITY_DN2427_c1_g1_i1:30-470(+)